MRAILIALLVLAGAARCATAEPITIAFTGFDREFPSDSTSLIFGQPIARGDRFSGSFTYEAAHPTEPFFGPDDRIVTFPGAPYGMSVTVGIQTAQQSGSRCG